MTGPEHYAEAERLMVRLAEISNTPGPVDRKATLVISSVAQVHATLALAAATAMGAGRADTENGAMDAVDFRAWDEVAGVQP